MDYALLIIYSVVVVYAIIFTIINYKHWKHISQKEIEQYKAHNYNEEKNKILEKVYIEIQDSLDKLNTLNNEIEQKKNFNESLLKIREDELNQLLQEKKKNREREIELEIADWAKSAQEAANINSRILMEEINLELNDMNDYTNTIKAELEDYRAKRDAINQEIIRCRAIEERQEFYKVQLDATSIADIKVLNRIRAELSKINLLDKLIYDNYVGKPVNEMIKRVLNGASPSGIYKITRLKTGEVYIGKSTDVKARWQQHAKSAFHCGTISHSTLHTTMEKDGIENFTWELIEEVPKDKLSDREKYWINFYDSKKYGMNEKEG